MPDQPRTYSATRDEDNPLDDWGEPSGGMQHGVDHTRRPLKTEAERGQGPKTIRRNKEIASGALKRRR